MKCLPSRGDASTLDLLPANIHFFTELKETSLLCRTQHFLEGYVY